MVLLTNVSIGGEVANRSEVPREPRTLWVSFWLLVTYSAIDVAITWIRTQRTVADAMSSEISLIRTPLAMMGDSLLLLAATVSARVGRVWGHLAAIAFSTWLLYRGLEKLNAIAAATDRSSFSWSVISYWWFYANAVWDFPRLILAVVVIVYALIVLNRSYFKSPATHF